MQIYIEYFDIFVNESQSKYHAFTKIKNFLKCRDEVNSDQTSPSRISIRNTIRLLNSLDPDQAQHLLILSWVQTVVNVISRRHW